MLVNCQHKCTILIHTHILKLDRYDLIIEEFIIKVILQIVRQMLLCASAGLVSARPQFGPIGPAHGPHHAPGYAPVKIPPRPFAYEYGVQVSDI